jgi:hypothetical protein
MLDDFCFSITTEVVEFKLNARVPSKCLNVIEFKLNAQGFSQDFETISHFCRTDFFLKL